MDAGLPTLPHWSGSRALQLPPPLVLVPLCCVSAARDAVALLPPFSRLVDLVAVRAQQQQEVPYTREKRERVYMYIYMYNVGDDKMMMNACADSA